MYSIVSEIANMVELLIQRYVFLNEKAASKVTPRFRMESTGNIFMSDFLILG